MECFAYFISDKRFSFDTLLFYGNELMFLIFEVLFFAIIDLVSFIWSFRLTKGL